MKKTFKDLSEVDNIMSGIYEAHPEAGNTKFWYAYKRFGEKTFSPIYRDFLENLTDIRISHALADKITDAIIYSKSNHRGFEYSKDGLKAVIAAEKKLTEEWDKKEFDIVPFVIKPEDVPKYLTEEQKEMLTGIVI